LHNNNNNNNNNSRCEYSHISYWSFEWPRWT